MKLIDFEYLKPKYALISFFLSFFFQAICNTTDNPKLFLKYFNYLDSIKVAYEKPDYDWLTDLFASQLTDEQLKNPNLGIFDAPRITELEAQFMGKIIDGRFEIKNYLRSEFAGFIHSGMNCYTQHILLFSTVERLNCFFRFFFPPKPLGFDLEKNTDVIIKIGSDANSWLETEHKNFLHLGADGGSGF